jgi:hypothetical protein
MSKKQGAILPTSRMIHEREMAKLEKQNNRGEKIKATMLEKHAKSVFCFGYFQSLSQAKEKLGVQNIQIINADKSGGTAKSLNWIKDEAKLALIKKHVEAIIRIQNEGK